MRSQTVIDGALKYLNTRNPQLSENSSPPSSTSELSKINVETTLESLSHLIVYSCVQVVSFTRLLAGLMVILLLTILLSWLHVTWLQEVSCLKLPLIQIRFPISRQMEVSGQQQIALGVINISRSAELTAVDPNHLHLAAYADGLD